MHIFWLGLAVGFRPKIFVVCRISKSFLGCGIWALLPRFCVICTSNSELKYIFDLYHQWVSRGRYPLFSSGRIRHLLDSKSLSCGTFDFPWKKAQNKWMCLGFCLGVYIALLGQSVGLGLGRILFVQRHFSLVYIVIIFFFFSGFWKPSLLPFFHSWGSKTQPIHWTKRWRAPD